MNHSNEEVIKSLKYLGIRLCGEEVDRKLNEVFKHGIQHLASYERHLIKAGAEIAMTALDLTEKPHILVWDSKWLDKLGLKEEFKIKDFKKELYEEVFKTGLLPGSWGSRMKRILAVLLFNLVRTYLSDRKGYSSIQPDLRCAGLILICETLKNPAVDKLTQDEIKKIYDGLNHAIKNPSEMNDEIVQRIEKIRTENTCIVDE